MTYDQHDTHHTALFSRRFLVSLALSALVAIGGLFALGGDTGTVVPPTVTQSPSASPSALLAARAAAATPTTGKAQSAPDQPAAASLEPTQAPALPATPVPAPEPVAGRAGLTTDDYVNLREGPGTGYPILGQLPADAPAKVLDEQAGWYHIETPWDSSGWIAGDLFELTPEPATPAEPQRLGTAGTVGSVNLREGPGAEYPSYGKLSDGSVLEVLALEGEWYKVRTPRGAVGWVAAEYVALDWIPDVYGGSGAPAEASSSDAVQVAQEYLGARYLWGGSYPSGFDCSGLTWYVYREVGVRIPAGSVQQFDTDYGRYVRSMDTLAPGDLVFFERTAEGPDITHVGIYAGGGKMIAARSERLGVRYVSLSEPFWNSRFVGGIRPYR